jgi:predicted nucleic acid-binding protein
MILADTSVWVDHLRRGEPRLSDLLDTGQILVHPFIVGEIALGQMRRRAAIVENLLNLPRVQTAADDEVLRFMQAHSLPGTGIGYVDAHLLASVQLSAGSWLWTRDRRLRTAAKHLSLAADIT